MLGCSCAHGKHRNSTVMIYEMINRPYFSAQQKTPLRAFYCLAEKEGFAYAPQAAVCHAWQTLRIPPQAKQLACFLHQQKTPLRAFYCLAEKEGFEPSIHFLGVCSLSRGVPSTTRPPLRIFCAGRIVRARPR